MHPFLFIALVLPISWVVQVVVFTGMIPQIPVVLYMFVPAILAFIFFLAQKNRWRAQAKLFVSRPIGKSLLFAVVFPFSFFIAISVLAVVLGIGEVNLTFIPTLLSMSFWSGLGTAFLLMIPSMFGEEYGWRGYLLPALCERYNKSAATLIVGIVWGMWHIPSYYISYSIADIGSPIMLTILGMTVGVVASFAYSYCFFLSENIVPVIVLHILWDLLARSLFFSSPVIKGLQAAEPGLLRIAWPAPLILIMLSAAVLAPAFAMSKAFRNRPEEISD
jgi:membrane protease YdiL (CAAX protease family)